jgi:hypothetical protein
MDRENNEQYQRSESEEFPYDPKLRAMTDSILAQPVDARLRQLEAEANFFLSARRLPE